MFHELSVRARRGHLSLVNKWIEDIQVEQKVHIHKFERKKNQHRSWLIDSEQVLNKINEAKAMETKKIVETSFWWEKKRTIVQSKNERAISKKICRMRLQPTNILFYFLHFFSLFYSLYSFLHTMSWSLSFCTRDCCLFPSSCNSYWMNEWMNDVYFKLNVHI